ncbi:hypothetical protein [Cellulomonas aerilata]|uniref:Uncharacterized protein n=1 Tax=Cellulomonas aerilata TaxID=515326 RepID=A0A512DBL0_9CELL|nr:hypothetical protein [Cellulomonas aerilata]GEO33853.1 hypothetical protein CAE01nite_15780 [Cellulomonas aerilata]
MGTDRARAVFGRLLDETLSRVDALAEDDMTVAEAVTLADVACALPCVWTRLDRRRP